MYRFLNSVNLNILVKPGQKNGNSQNGNGRTIGKLSMAGLIITLGIAYGDIGTSPLYVFEAISGVLHEISKETVYGSLSCIFWTLTLQTTVKYIIITLRADNKGEGGIFALFALIRKRYRWAYIIAIIGGSTLLADGIITPAITVTSAIEGLSILNPNIPVVMIVCIILSFLFFVQQFGTELIGKSFGPLMLIWFLLLTVIGSYYVVQYPGIFSAVNPVYAIQLLSKHPGGFFVLGAVFLATTGAEALYSDLGHCGIKNIRISWIFVKTALLLNYFGQGAWMIHHYDAANSGINPFFAIMPGWFIMPGVIIAAIAAIIASQALLSGSFTVISEAISLNFWPKMTIKYPTYIKGQMYVPNINIFLWIGCLCVVTLFQKSSAMQAAYGLSITMTMMMTTVLLLLYLSKSLKPYLLILFGVVYFAIEGAFLLANLNKFSHGGWFTVVTAGILTVIMYSWYNGREIKNNLMNYTPINRISEVLRKVREDKMIPKFATNLVYISKADREHLIESTIVYSLLDKQPKRADIYWFIHINIMDEPYAYEYKVTHIVPGIIIKVDFYLGFREEPRINIYFRQVLEDLNKTGEIKTESRYPSLRGFSITGDCRYILIDRILTADHQFNIQERLIMNISDIVKILAIPESKSLHLDASNILLEMVPLGKPDRLPDRIRRVPYENHTAE